MLAGFGPLQDLGEEQGVAVLPFQVADYRQVELQQGVASNRAIAGHAAVQFRPHRLLPAAGDQRVEAGEQAVAVEPGHHRAPPAGQHGRDPQTAVEHAVVGRQIGDQAERLIGFELLDGARTARQDVSQRGGHRAIDARHAAGPRQIVDRHGQRSHPLAGRQRPQVGRGCRGDVLAIADHVEHQALDAQDRLQRPAPQVRGALQVPLRELEPTSPAALIGGLEKPRRLQVEDPLVVRGAPPRLGQRRLRAPVRIPGVVQGDHVQPRLGVVGMALRQLLQDAPHPDGAAERGPAQQIEQGTVRGRRLRIGGQAGHHQVDQHRRRVLGARAQQDRERLHRRGIEEVRADPRVDAGAGERFQHAGTRHRLVGPAGKHDRQLVEVVLGNRRIPHVAGLQFLRQQDGLRQDTEGAVAGHDAADHASERVDRQRALDRRSAGDQQQVDPRPDGVLRVDGVRQADQVPLDLRRGTGVDRLAQAGGGSRNRRGPGAERPPHRVRSRRPGTGGGAPELGHRAAQREVLRQQVDGAPQTVLVTGGEASHRLAEQPPGSERRAARHACKETCGTLPVTGVHGAQAAPYRIGVPPERVLGVEVLDAIPAAIDHQAIGHRPLGRGQRRPGGEALRVDRRGVAPLQTAQKADQVFFREVLDVDRRAMLHGAAPQRRGLLRRSLAVQLPRAFDAGMEEPQRRHRRRAVLA